MFNHVIQALGPPGRPLNDLDLADISYAGLDETLAGELSHFESEFGTVKSPHFNEI